MKRYFENLNGVLAVLSEKKDGSMKIVAVGGNDGNRESFFAKVGIELQRVVSAGLRNGTNIEIVNGDSPKVVEGVDGLVAKGRNIFLSITVADCIPVFFFEPESEIVAIAHCGWRGIVGGIVKNILDSIKELEGKMDNLKVALGPGIDVCHFEIRKDVLDRFAEYEKYLIKKDGKIFVDLKGIIFEQLVKNGVRKEKIENDGECTFESEKYFSFRRDKPEVIEAMVAVIGIQ